MNQSALLTKTMCNSPLCPQHCHDLESKTIFPPHIFSSSFFLSKGLKIHINLTKKGYLGVSLWLWYLVILPLKIAIFHYKHYKQTTKTSKRSTLGIQAVAKLSTSWSLYMYTKEKEIEQTSVSHVNRGNTRASWGLLMSQQLMLHAMKVLHLSKNLILPINPIPYPSALETYRTIHEKGASVHNWTTWRTLHNSHGNFQRDADKCFNTASNEYRNHILPGRTPGQHWTTAKWCSSPSLGKPGQLTNWRSCCRTNKGRKYWKQSQQIFQQSSKGTS